jgi:hypothetical protein
MSIKNNQQGSILIFSLSIMSVVLAISLSILAIYIPKIKTIRETANSMGAIYSADSILEWCIYEARNVGNAAVPTMANGATYTLDANSPPFGGDPCPYAAIINHRAVGTFSGVSRSLEVGEVAGP